MLYQWLQQLPTSACSLQHLKQVGQNYFFSIRISPLQQPALLDLDSFSKGGDRSLHWDSSETGQVTV